MKDNENSLESLDKKTCDQVTHDMQICMDDWTKKDLDTRAAIISLTRFCVEL